MQNNIAAKVQDEDVWINLKLWGWLVSTLKSHKKQEGVRVKPG